MDPGSDLRCRSWEPITAVEPSRNSLLQGVIRPRLIASGYTSTNTSVPSLWYVKVGTVLIPESQFPLFFCRYRPLRHSHRFNPSFIMPWHAFLFLFMIWILTTIQFSPTTLPIYSIELQLIDILGDWRIGKMNVEWSVGSSLSSHGVISSLI